MASIIRHTAHCLLKLTIRKTRFSQSVTSARSLTWLAVHSQQHNRPNVRISSSDLNSTSTEATKGSPPLVCIIPMDLDDQHLNKHKLYIKNIACAHETWSPVRPAVSEVQAQEHDLVEESKVQVLEEEKLQGVGEK